MTKPYACFIQKKPTDNPIFYVDETLLIKLDVERNILNDRITKFELTCFALEKDIFEIKYVYKCSLGLAQPIVILHILKNDGAIDKQTKTFNNNELNSLDLAQVYDKELFVFVLHNRTSLSELEEPDADLCTLDGAIPETKDGTIIVSIW